MIKASREDTLIENATKLSISKSLYHVHIRVWKPRKDGKVGKRRKGSFRSRKLATRVEINFDSPCTRAFHARTHPLINHDCPHQREISLFLRRRRVRVVCVGRNGTPNEDRLAFLRPVEIAYSAKTDRNPTVLNARLRPATSRPENQPIMTPVNEAACC